MIRDSRGLVQIEYIVLAAIVLAAVGSAAWALARAIAARLDAYRNGL